MTWLVCDVDGCHRRVAVTILPGMSPYPVQSGWQFDSIGDGHARCPEHADRG